jgi:HlyD family secretion protein
MKSRGRILLWMLAMLAIAAALWAWVAQQRQAVPVEVFRVERGRVEQTATNSRAGTVKARRRARLSPELGGRVLAIPRRQGESVAAGEIVLSLDDALERAEVDLREREVSAARADAHRACLGAERAARELARNRQLAADGILSADILDRFESIAREAGAACDATNSRVGSAYAGLALVQRNLAKRTLRAPFDGVVAEVSIEVGEWTTPSPPALPVPPVLDILDPSSIYLELPMDEVDAARLRPGLAVRATIDSHPGRGFPGRIARVAPYVLDLEAQNRTVAIEVELDDTSLARQLLPGTSADVEVILDVHEAALRLPAAAVLTGDRVLLVEDGRLVERRVEAGLRNWDFIEIVAGLAEGDAIVTSLDRPEVRAGARAAIVAAVPRE